MSSSFLQEVVNVAAVRRVEISASIRLDRPAELDALIEPPDGAAAVVTTMAETARRADSLDACQ